MVAERVSEMRDFFAFVRSRVPALLEEWQASRTAQSGSLWGRGRGDSPDGSSDTAGARSTGARSAGALPFSPCPATWPLNGYE